MNYPKETMLAQVSSRSKTIKNVIGINHQQILEVAAMMVQHERFYCYEYSLALADLFGDSVRSQIWAIIDHTRDGDLTDEQVLQKLRRIKT